MSPAGFVVSWFGGEGAGDDQWRSSRRLFDSAGNPVTDDLEVNTDHDHSARALPPDVAMNAKGDFVVVWDDAKHRLSTGLSGRR